METYIVRPDSQKPTLKQRAVSVLCLSGIYFTLLFGCKFLWPTSSERNHGLLGITIETGVLSLLWGLTMVFWPRRLPSYKLLLDDESITSVLEFTGWMKWWVVRRTISKGKVRTIWEIKGKQGVPRGMGFSERSRLGARMWGFVFVPSNLPDYESIKMLAETWRSREGTD
jgi:hypothetical protein